MLQFADSLVADQFARETKVSIAALLAADLKNAFAGLHGLDQMFAFVNTKGQRLFGINILAGFYREGVYEGVPVVRGAGNDNVNVVPLHELTKIGIDLWNLIAGLELLGSSLAMGLVHVTDSEHFPKAAGAIAIASALATTADQRNAGFVIGAERVRSGCGL